MPDEVQPHDLDRDARKELLSLSRETADLVARHLVMAGRLMDDEPQAALPHARAARALAGRIGAVREAAGLVAYAAGEWSESLSELRAARRITGEPDHLPVMADCERALGRPERALLVAEDPQVSRLSPAARVEMLIVVSGARRDLGQADAAVVTLQVSALDASPVRPWTARLRYAYADALLGAGRDDEARAWFARTVDADEDGQTDAEERLLAIDGIVLEDLLGDDADADATDLDNSEAAGLVVDAADGPRDVPAHVEEAAGSGRRQRPAPSTTDLALLGETGDDGVGAAGVVGPVDAEITASASHPQPLPGVAEHSTPQVLFQQALDRAAGEPDQRPTD